MKKLILVSLVILATASLTGFLGSFIVSYDSWFSLYIIVIPVLLFSIFLNFIGVPVEVVIPVAYGTLFVVFLITYRLIK
ncbi:MAG: hypothetical protein UX07_C0001G0013 [Parcubacteria group bacterium GW2011_GWA2_45_30]|nr:MAG: hypothetical protein UX07_C0001G0013 [Parcubacteria group bacterium GW2011_GWA2_45_30]